MKNTILSIILAALVVVGFVAQAGDSIPGPLLISCEGGYGRTQFYLKPGGVLDFGIEYKGKSIKGHVEPFDDASGYSPGGSAYLIKYAPSPEDPEKPSELLSIGGSIAEKVWVPEHTECAPTRTNQCIPRTVKGQYKNLWKKHVDLVLYAKNPGQFYFARIELNGKTLTTLGPGSSCSVKGL